MKRKAMIGGGAAALALLLLGMVLWPLARRELDWRAAAGGDTEAAYLAFLKEWPDGRHSASARARAGERAWQQAQATGTVEAYQRYQRDYSAGASAAEAAAAIDRLRWEPVKAAATVPDHLDEFLRSYPDSRHAEEARALQEDLSWKQVSEINTAGSLDRYLRAYPNGRYVAQARTQRERLRWQETESKNTVAAYEAYLTEYKEGANASAARARIEDIHWTMALSAPTIRGLNAFADRFPAGAHAAEARGRAAALAAEDAPFRAAESAGSRQAYQTFLADFPGHQQEGVARGRLAVMDTDLAGRPLLDLMAEGKVTATVNGAGLRSVSMTVRNSAKHDIRVIVPAGTYFVAGRASVQNMIAIGESSVVVRAGGSQSLSVSVACANVYRDVPASGDTFTVQRAGPGEVSRYAAAIGTATATDFAVRQAAVWILSDNANYSTLGRLVVNGFTRQIEEEQTVRALRILDGAGLDIRTRAVWADRVTIMNGLRDMELRRWWREKTGLPVVTPAPGATLRATFYQGGVLTFTVAPDGQSVTNVRLEGYRCGDNTASAEGSGPAALTDGVFTALGTQGLKVEGAFISGRQVQGEIEVKAGTSTCWAPFATG